MSIPGKLDPTASYYLVLCGGGDYEYPEIDGLYLTKNEAVNAARSKATSRNDITYYPYRICHVVAEINCPLQPKPVVEYLS